MRTFTKTALQESNSVSYIFPNILEENYVKLSKNTPGIVSLIQPLIITVGQRLRQLQPSQLVTEGDASLYKISQEILIDFVKITSTSMALLDKSLNYMSMSDSWKNNPLLISKTPNPLGSNYKQISPYQTPQWINILEQALLGKSMHIQEDLCTLPNGLQRWMRWEIEPWEEAQNQIGGILIFCEDITDKIELQQHADRLTLEKNELESFAYMCPHDLQAHIKTLSNFISFLEKGDQRRHDPDVNEFYKYIFAALGHMKSLVEDCLRHANVHTETVTTNPQDLNEIANTLLGIFKSQIESKDGCIECDPLPTVWCHKQTVQQVFENLITNALKFCENPPRIRIYPEETKTEWIIHFQDNGIGMTTKDQEGLFKSFYRIHSQEKFPGTGLGLSFCKKIMELHQGRIWVKSAEGKGSTFSLSFPKRVA